MGDYLFLTRTISKQNFHPGYYDSYHFQSRFSNHDYKMPKMPLQIAKAWIISSHENTCLHWFTKVIANIAYRATVEGK